MDKRAPLRLLHVFPSFAVGGSQVRFGQLVRLHGERYRHTVIALNGDIGMSGQIATSAPIKFEDHSVQRPSLVQGVTAALETLDRIRPHALVTYNWGSMNWWVAKRLRPGIRHVHIEDGFGPEEKKKQYVRRV